MKKLFNFKNGQINVFFIFSLIWPIFMILFLIFQHCAHVAILPLHNLTKICDTLINFPSPLVDCKIDFIIWPKNSNFLFLAKISINPKILLKEHYRLGKNLLDLFSFIRTFFAFFIGKRKYDAYRNKNLQA